MHPERLKARGFNHAQLLADGVAARWSVDSLPETALQRTRHTPRQVGQAYADRLANVSGCFWADPSEVSGKTVAVVDDVCTTGATLSACAQALLDAGAHTVYGITLARTP